MRWMPTVFADDRGTIRALLRYIGFVNTLINGTFPAEIPWPVMIGLLTVFNPNRFNFGRVDSRTAQLKG